MHEKNSYTVFATLDAISRVLNFHSSMGHGSQLRESKNRISMIKADRLAKYSEIAKRRVLLS